MKGLIFIICTYVFGQLFGIKVYKNNINSDQVSSATIQNLNLSFYKELTLCLRVYYHQFPVASLNVDYWKSAPLLSTGESGSDGYIMFNVVNVETKRMGKDLRYINGPIFKSKDVKNIVSINNTFKVLSNTNMFDLERWNTVCLKGRRHNSPMFSITINGEEIFLMNGYPSDELSGGIQVFGWKDIEGSFGKFTDFNIWNKLLTEHDLENWRIHGTTEIEPALSWESINSGLIIRNFNTEDLDLDDVLPQQSKPNLILFYETRNFQTSYRACGKIGGEIATPHENIDEDAWREKLVSGNVSDRVWVSYKLSEEGSYNFENIYTRTPARWLPWETGQPNNWGGQEECVVYSRVDQGLRDDFCGQDTAAVICVVPSHTHFMMQGVCITSPVDTFYQLTSATTLLGYTQTSVTWSVSRSRWEIVFSLNQTLLAFTNTTREFPIGTHPWYFINNVPCTHNTSVSWRLLLLHPSVDQPGHFCCSDGTCLSSEQVCDHNQHCEDRSDEEQCQMVTRPQYYSTDFPPTQRLANESHVTFPLLNVETRVIINKIFGIDPASTSINILFTVILEWQDLNLSFNFLKDNYNYNAITDPEVWRPNIRISLLKGSDEFPKIVDEKFLVKKKALPNLSNDVDLLSFNETYPGAENSLYLQTIYQANFVCIYDGIKDYPFGINKCHLRIFTTGSVNKMLRFTNLSVENHLIGNITEQYIINNITIQESMSQGLSNVVVEITMFRSWASVFLVTYLPTILMNMINQVTKYIVEYVTRISLI